MESKVDWAQLLDEAKGIYGHWTVVIDVFFIVLAVLVLNRIFHWALRALVKREDRSEQVWRHAILDALDPPLRTIIWIIGLTIAVRILANTSKNSILAELFPPASNVVAILAIAWFLLRVAHRAEANLHARAIRSGEPIDRTAADAIGKLVRAAIIITAALVIMQTLGFSISGLLAFGGAAGIAVGFAAQSLVANLLGGLTVYASRIFKIGEDIIIPGTKLAGTVHQIGWRATRVVGWDGKPFYVPNSLFNSANMINHSRLVHRAFTESVLLRYRDLDKVQAIIRKGNEVLSERDDLNYFVFRFDSFGDAALKLNIYAWPQNTPQPTFLPYAEFARIKEEVLLEIAAIAIDEGCELIQPFSHVYLREEEKPALPESAAIPESDS